VNAIVQNAGQTCSAGSRLLVQRSIYQAVLDRLATTFIGLRAGPPDLELEMGPLVNRKPYDVVKRFPQQAEEERIPVAATGVVHPEASSTGYYQAAVLLRDVPHTSALAQRKICGRVLAAMPFDDEAEAIRLANGTDYGLVRASGRATARASCAWRARCAAGRCSSTTTARGAASSSRSAA